MQITFLGTSSMMPTKERNNTAILIRHNKEHILLDCGENTQRQLRIAKIPAPKITKILITHWHGDHVLGIPGLIQSLAAQQYQKTLEIYGPPGTKRFMKNIMDTFILRTKRQIEIEVKEIKKPGTFFETDDFEIEAYKLDHSSYCLGYAFKEKQRRKIRISYTKKFGLTNHPLLGKLQKGKNIEYKGKEITVEKATYIEKGKKVAFILDTALTDNCYKLAQNSDILVTEATLAENLKKLAEERKHLTAKGAATIAKKSKVKRLILTHFSQRYSKNTDILKKEAQKIFKNTTCAEDFTKFTL